MIDANQVLLITAITVTTILLTIIGIQLIFVLRDFRRVLGRINSIFDELHRIGTGVNHSYGEVVGFVVGIRKLLEIVEFISNKGKSNERKK